MRQGVKVRFPRGVLFSLPLYAALAISTLGYAVKHPDMPQKVMAAIEAAAPRPIAEASTLEEMLEPSVPEEPIDIEPLADGEYLLVGAFDPAKRFLRENITNLQNRDYQVQTEEGPNGLVRIAIDLENLTDDRITDIVSYLAERDSKGMIVSKRNGVVSDWTDISTKIEGIFDAYIADQGAFPYQDLVEDALRQVRGIDSQFDARVRLYGAIMRQESVYDPAAESRKGAQGLMQVMPHMEGPIQRNLLGREPVEGFIDDPAQNVLAGVALFEDANRFWTRRLGRSWDDPEVLKFSLAEYNAGRTAAKVYQASGETYAETADYVPEVLEHLAQLAP